jgi:AraC family transcriptional regulator
MNVEIILFPLTMLACVEHLGSPALEHETAKRLLAWKLEHRLMDPMKYRHYGVHYTDPRITPPSQHRVDFCISFDGNIEENPYGVITKIIPANRCARARDIGSRYNNKAALFLQENWLPQSRELAGSFPMFFHYVNVGPNVKEDDMITDVYLPLK